MFPGANLTRQTIRLGRGCRLPQIKGSISNFSSERNEDYKGLLKSIKKSKKLRGVYPQFSSPESDSNVQPDLNALLKSLRDDNKETASVVNDDSSVSLSVDLAPRRNLPAHLRVEALFKHASDADALHTSLKLHKADASVPKDEHDSAANYLIEKNSVEMKEQKEKSRDIRPDDSEVGNLLKALMEKKINDQNVRDIMANVRSGSKIGRVDDDVRTAIRGGAVMRLSEKQSFKKEDVSFVKEIRMRDKKSTKKVGKYGGLFVGPRTHYFDDDLTASRDEDGTKFMSIHELKWKENLRNMIRDDGPSNAFEELILQAEKMWSFPIDNEVGLDEEDESNFEDHVFLDEHLSLFAEHGNVRRFMELVVTGLQQNPYISLKQKVDTIFYFKEYFDKFSIDDLEL